jgi:hypothetical protein
MRIIHHAPTYTIIGSYSYSSLPRFLISVTIPSWSDGWNRTLFGHPRRFQLVVEQCIALGLCCTNRMPRYAFFPCFSGFLCSGTDWLPYPVIGCNRVSFSFHSSERKTTPSVLSWIYLPVSLLLRLVHVNAMITCMIVAVPELISV